ncbi:MAG TPA: Crp/Fnr family transcriptional regulator [Terriglobia bacterium]|nr:Crp/Fnr family transcriptional regulator [Terriglobia bacterium]
MIDLAVKSRIDRRTNAVKQLLLRRFQSLVQLSPIEEDALARWAAGLDEHPAGSELQRDDEPGRRPCLITQGWACCQHVLRDGRRQVISILVPGDPLDLRMRPHPFAVTTTVALTRVETCNLNALRHAIVTGSPDYGNLIKACDMIGATEEYYLMHQIVRLGRQNAYERLAHLLMELYHRLQLAGLAQDGRFFLPITQELLADTLGLSSVHINRTLQQLRRDKLIHWKGGLFKLLEPETLSMVADFQPKLRAPGGAILEQQLA